jgi:membrane-bound inhibitor of C-type lysozyme
MAQGKHMRTRRKIAVAAFRAAALAIAALAAGCVVSAGGTPETVLPADNLYACRDGSMLRVARQPDGRQAYIAIGKQSVRLMRADSAAQEKYSDGTTTLYLDGENALVTSDSFVVAGPCVSTVPLPQTQRY